MPRVQERGEDCSFEPMIAEVFLLQCMCIWQIPLLAGTAWWNTLEAGWSRDPMPHHHTNHDQLVVPEPIDGEDK